MSVILAYDGRPASRRALDFAIDYAKMSDRPLYIYTSVASPNIAEHEEEMARIKAFVREAADIAIAEGVEVHTIIEPGPVGENILSAASRFDAVLIVIGRSDKTVIDRVVLGSTSQYIVDNAKHNVTVVH